MGFLDKVTNLREKANRLGIDDVVERTQDRNDEARKRIDAGRKTLTAVLEGNTDAVRTKVSELAGQGDAVGKITQVMGEVAPVLQQNTAAVKAAVQQLDVAANEIAQHGADIANVGAHVENAMGNLLEQTNLPANVLPKNLVSDLVTDAIEDNTPKVSTNEENLPPEPVSTTPGAGSPATSGKKKRKKRNEGAGPDQTKPTGTGRPKLRELARNSGFLDSFRAPSNVTSFVTNPMGSVENNASGGFGAGLGGLGSLGGGGVDIGAVSVGREGVSITGELGSGIEGEVTVGRDGVTLDASMETGGGTTGTAGVTVGEDGPSVHGELSRETSLGTVTAGVEVGENGPSAYGEIEGDLGHGSVTVDAGGMSAEGNLGPVSGSVGPDGVSSNLGELLGGGTRTIGALAGIGQELVGAGLGDIGSGSPAEIAVKGTQGSGNPLPFLDKIQQSFGEHDVTSIRSHTGGSATEASTSLGATAYAVGDAIAFRSAPDLHTAAHEAAHVVQQRHGVTLPGGIDTPGDEYERHADQVADAVVAGNSATSLLDTFIGGRSGGSGGLSVQRKDDKIERPKNPRVVKDLYDGITAIMEGRHSEAQLKLYGEVLAKDVPAEYTPADWAPFLYVNFAKFATNTEPKALGWFKNNLSHAAPLIGGYYARLVAIAEAVADRVRKAEAEKRAREQRKDGSLSSTVTKREAQGIVAFMIFDADFTQARLQKVMMALSKAGFDDNARSIAQQMIVARYKLSSTAAGTNEVIAERLDVYDRHVQSALTAGVIAPSHKVRLLAWSADYRKKYPARTAYERERDRVVGLNAKVADNQELVFGLIALRESMDKRDGWTVRPAFTLRLEHDLATSLIREVLPLLTDAVDSKDRAKIDAVLEHRWMRQLKGDSRFKGDPRKLATFLETQNAAGLAQGELVTDLLSLTPVGPLAKVLLATPIELLKFKTGQQGMVVTLTNIAIKAMSGPLDEVTGGAAVRDAMLSAARGFVESAVPDLLTVLTSNLTWEQSLAAAEPIFKKACIAGFIAALSGRLKHVVGNMPPGMRKLWAETFLDACGKLGIERQIKPELDKFMAEVMKPVS